MRTTKYGVRVRHRVDSVLELKNQKHKCPRCKKTAVKRLSSGIWACKRCGLTIADNAYAFTIKSLR